MLSRICRLRIGPDDKKIRLIGSCRHTNSAGFSAGEAQLLIETSLDFGMKVNNL